MKSSPGIIVEWRIRKCEIYSLYQAVHDILKYILAPKMGPNYNKILHSAGFYCAFNFIEYML